jgi:hypothetical protein
MSGRGRALRPVVSLEDSQSPSAPSSAGKKSLSPAAINTADAMFEGSCTSAMVIPRHDDPSCDPRR